MFRKTFCILFALALIAVFVVPAAAVGSGSVLYYSPISFDLLCTGTNWSERYEWEVNGIGSSTTLVGQDGGNYGYSVSISKNSVSLDVLTDSSFRLIAYDQVLDISSIRNFRIGFGVDLEFTGTISYSFQLVDMRRYADEWGQNWTPVSGSVNVIAGRYVDIGTELVRAISEHTSNRYVRVQNLVLTFEIDSDGGIDYVPAFEFLFNGSALFNPRNGLTQWLDQYDMIVEKLIVVDPAHPDDANFVAWLGDTASGFLSAPLFGEFSIGGLLAAVLSIGFVVALIKFFS